MTTDDMIKLLEKALVMPSPMTDSEIEAYWHNFYENTILISKGANMGINRSIDALRPPLAAAVRRFLARCEEEDFPVVVIETDRTQAVQDAYYAQGRQVVEAVNDLRKAAGLYLIKERENIVVTNARFSNHTGGNAVDICPEIGGKPGFPWWNAPQTEWQWMGSLAEECGLDWCAGGYGQTWGKGWDNPHFELMKGKEAA